MIDKARLEQKCSMWNIALTGTQLDQLDAFARILVDYNQKVNLTAITDPEGIEDKHFLDSLLFASQPEVAGKMVDVGAGAGTICYGMKGGIGSASRVICIGEKEYTIGVLVQSNFGATEDFVLNGEAVGPKILEWKQEKNDMAASEEDKGSIMSILATDLPVTSRQLKRILKRTGVGIARTGGYTGHGSGEVMIGFTTANRIPSGREEELLQISAIPEHVINQAFLAAAEAEQEAILNSMTAAKQTRGREGELYYSLAEYLNDREVETSK